MLCLAASIGRILYVSPPVAAAECIVIIIRVRGIKR